MIESGKQTIISICICTYNRADYLQLCIEKLIPQIAQKPVLISVIDNNSNDHTEAYVRKLQEENTLIKYVFEPQQGLSHARNKAWQAAASEWVFYLDDDCLPSEDIVEVALNLIQFYPQGDAFGGPIDAIFDGVLPGWLPEGYGSFSMPFETTTIIDDGFIRGGCFLIRRSVLATLQGFDPEYGVTGEKLKYGEEIELQLRMRKMGFKIAYAPALRTGHFVRSEKLNLKWVLQSEYARRRDKMLIEPLSLFTATINLLRTILGRLFWTPVHLGTVLIQKNYTFKKALFQSLQPLAYRLGEWIGVLQHKR